MRGRAGSGCSRRRRAEHDIGRLFVRPVSVGRCPGRRLEAGETLTNNAGASGAANGRFDIIVHYSGNPTYQAAFTQAAAPGRRSSSPTFPTTPASMISTRRQHRVDRRIGWNSRTGRSGSLRPGSRLPAHGEMEFDSADVANMFARNWTVILHEMGHILGIGTIWSCRPRTARATTSGPTALPNTARSPAIRRRYRFRIEHDGGSGTAGAHWDEDTFNAELMTGFAEFPASPCRSPDDDRLAGGLGYTVNYAAADPYTLAGWCAARRAHGDTVNGGTAAATHLGLGGDTDTAARSPTVRQAMRGHDLGLHRQSRYARRPGRERHAGRRRASALCRRHDPSQRRQHAVRHGLL